MGSTFGGLSIASTGLAAHRQAIETAGHNVANVNTPGYSRQRVELASLASGAIGIHSGSSSQPGGVDIVAQTRITDVFVTERMNRESAAMGTADTLRAALRRIESAFNEPGDRGFAAQLQGFWDAWDAVVDRPEDLAVRSALLQTAASVADGVNALASRIATVGSDALQRADALTSEVNAIAGRIADLNGVIGAQTAAGVAPNDLMDQRDELVRALSGLVSVRTTTDTLGMMSVSISGSNLVSGTRHGTVSIDTSVPGATVLRMDASGTALQPADGTIPALLRVTDVEVPQQLARLDQVALRLADVVNTQHRLGNDLQDPPQAALDMFTATGAKDFSLSAALVGNPQLIGAGNPAQGRYDAGNAAAMAELAGSVGGPDQLYRSMVAELGIQVQSASGRAGLQEQVVERLQDERDAVSGVSIDEEMANLIAYQQAYQASARYLTAVDEMLERLINGTGLVGR